MAEPNKNYGDYYEDPKDDPRNAEEDTPFRLGDILTFTRDDGSKVSVEYLGLSELLCGLAHVRVVEDGRYTFVDPVKLSYGKTSRPMGVVSGGSNDYYKLPPHATDLMHIISHKEMSFARGNLMKALYRIGEKSGVSVDYDLDKLEFFLKELREMHKRNERI